MDSINRLKKEVDEIKNSLNSLRTNVSLSDTEIKNRAEAIKTQADTIKEKIQNEISIQKDKVKKEKAETLLKSVNDSINLYLQTFADTLKNKDNMNQPKNDDIFTKTKDWIWDQWSDVKSRDKRKEQPWWNTLRTLWFWAWLWLAWYGIYKWVKKLWNRAFWKKKNKDWEGDDTDKASDKKEDKSEEKESFWKSTWWKILKWAGITTASWWWVYFLGKSLHLWWNNDSSSKTDQVQTSTAWKIDTSKVDTRWFTPWPYPFKHITTPYKWISAYRVDNIKLNPLIWFNQLSLTWTEWKMIKLKVKNQSLHYNKNTAWYKKNNPCNVSPYPWDIWRLWSSKVADWQDHGKYRTMEDWIASFMKLMREGKNENKEYKYRNKSIQWINCSWMQWVYSQNEPDSLKALRVVWITRACNSLNISPFERLYTDDKETMMAFAQQTAINESWSYLDRAILERAYKKAFG